MQREHHSSGIMTTYESAVLNIGILVAMRHEFDAVRSVLIPQADPHTEQYSSVVSGSQGLINYHIFQSGIGTTNAAVGVCDLIHHYRPAFLFNLGTAALIRDPDLNLEVGDVLIASEHRQWDLDIGGPITHEWTPKRSYVDVLNCNSFQPDQRLLDQISDIKQEDLPNWGKAILFTGNSFFCTDEQHKLLPDIAAPVAVDMESFAVAQVCARKGVPFIAIRGISDNGRTNAGDDFYANVHRASQAGARLAHALAEQIAHSLLCKGGQL